MTPGIGRYGSAPAGPLGDAGATPLSLALFDADPRQVAPALLGRILVTVADGVVTGGRIVETEAYLGSDDPGSHAATRGITARNAVMYGPPGHAYVYFTYGNHHMLNVVCCPRGTAGAVLIRALEPTIGLEIMSVRRPGRPPSEYTNGPGKLAAALGIDLADNGVRLNDGRIWLYDAPAPDSDRIATSGRIGLSAGHEYDYRYYIREHPHVSRGRTGPSNVKTAPTIGARDAGSSG